MERHENEPKKEAPLYYGDYLQLETLLSAQRPVSVEKNKPAHDEHLFIVVHQAYELWFKQILHELRSIIAIMGRPEIPESNIAVVVSRLARILEIQKILLGHFDVLETMTPLDFLDFRDYLNPASGFQSKQFRLFEILVGLRPERREEYDSVKYDTRLSETDREEVQFAEKQDSLFDVVERWLKRNPFVEKDAFNFWNRYAERVRGIALADRKKIEENKMFSPDKKEKELEKWQAIFNDINKLLDKERYDKEVTNRTKRLSFEAMRSALMIFLYRDLPLLHLPYKLLDLLMAVDKMMTMWRYRHAEMVHRMIGKRIGTGGSSGYDYLRQAAAGHKVFGDLFDLSTYLLPKASLEGLMPDEIARQLSFAYGGGKEND